MNEDHKHKWEMVVPFLTDSPDFALGCQLGMIYEQLREELPDEKEIMISRELQEQVLLLLSRMGYRVEKQEMIDDHWMTIHICHKEKPLA